MYIGYMIPKNFVPAECLGYKYIGYHIRYSY
jgi:hypothetical protein